MTFIRPSMRRFKRLGRAAALIPMLAVPVMLVAAVSRASMPDVPVLQPWLWVIVAAPLAAILGATSSHLSPAIGRLLDALSAIPPVLLAGPALLLGWQAPGPTLALAAVVLIAPRVHRATAHMARGALEAGLALGLPLRTALARVWAPMVGPAATRATLRGLSRTAGIAAPLVALGHTDLLGAAVASGPNAAGATVLMLLIVLALEAGALSLEARA
jgi:small basic protein